MRPASLRTLSLLQWCMRRTKIKAADVMSVSEREGDVARASCRCICDICGLEYIDHPQIEEYTELHVVCDWSVYKL